MGTNCSFVVNLQSEFVQSLHLFLPLFLISKLCIIIAVTRTASVCDKGLKPERYSGHKAGNIVEMRGKGEKRNRTENGRKYVLKMVICQKYFKTLVW